MTRDPIAGTTAFLVILLATFAAPTLTRGQDAGPDTTRAVDDDAAPNSDTPPPDATAPPVRSDADRKPASGSAILDRPLPPREPSVVLHLSLDDSVRLALQRSFDVRIARTDRDISDRELIVERAVFDPFLTLGYTFSKNRRPTASFLDIGGGALQAAVQVNPFETTDLYGAIGGRTIIGTTYELRLAESGFDRPLASGALFGINPQESTVATATLTQPLLRGAWYAYNSARLQIAYNNQTLSRDALELAMNDLVYRVEQAYWNLVYATQNFESKENALAVGRENLDNARKKKEAGLLARSDVTLVENQVALRMIDHNDATTVLDDARDALLDLLHHGGDEQHSRWQPRGPARSSSGSANSYDDIEVVPTTAPDAIEIVPDRDASLVTAFGRRADYRQYATRLENQRLEVMIAEDAIWPKLDITGTWSQLGLDDSIEGSFDSLGTGRYYGWSVGVQLEVPLSLRGPRATYHKAQDNLRRLQLERGRTENTIILEVDQSLRRLRALYRKIQYTEQQVALQQLLYEDELEKLEAGKSIPYTVAEIRNDLIIQQAVALLAKADYMTSRAEYYKNTGQLLERHGVALAGSNKP